MLLDVRNLSVNYGSVRALEAVSFGVDSGEIVAMIGPNGAGKSTALKAVAGVLDFYNGRIGAGTIKFDGQDIAGITADQLVPLGLGLAPEGRRLFPSMTVRENLIMGAYTSGDRSKNEESLASILDLFPHLKDRLAQRAGTLSGGEQQMVSIGRALMVRPKLLLADEPSLGLSPNYVDLIFEKIVAINRLGVSILLVEQNARMAIDVAHRAYVFEIGRIAFDGPTTELRGQDRVKSVYLGG
jgi:branched-chain amino acid transport system ATP-binding protein